MKSIQGSSYMIGSPTGETIAIPHHYDPATAPYPSVAQPEELKAHFAREGFVVLRGLIPVELCDAVVHAFQDEVRPDRGYFYRHASDRPEQHVFTDHGFMKYPIMNLQDLPRSRFGRFQRHGMDVLTHLNVQAALQVLYGESSRLIHTMFFDGNQATWPHQDSYYIDAEEIGRMVGLWVALEDIQPGAGRFFICPKSHLLEFPILGRDMQLDPNGPEYKAHVVELMRAHGLEVHAPALRKGDAIVFPSTMIHGALQTTEPHFSRKCLTAHFVPASGGFVWHHTRQARLNMRPVNGVPVQYHKDRNDPKNALSFFLESRFPEAYRRTRQALGKN